MFKRKDGRWVERVTVGGKRKTIYGKTKAELKAKLEAIIIQQHNGATFGSVADKWSNVHREQVGQKTWANYLPHYEDIVSQYEETPISDITALDVINDLKRAVARGYSATIVSTRRSLFNMILDQAVIDGHISVNPASSVPMPRNLVRNHREAPPPEVFELIMENVDKPFGLFVAILACTGLRKAEALALTWGDIGTDHIRVNKALDFTVHQRPVLKTPKTKAGVRNVPVLSVLKPYLKRPSGAASSDLLFPAVTSNRNTGACGYMTEGQYRGAWARYCAEVGLVDSDGTPTITAHQLRHGMATMGFEAGMDEKTMQLILGHASPTTTRDIYTHLRAKKQQESVSKLDDMVSKMVHKTS